MRTTLINNAWDDNLNTDKRIIDIKVNCSIISMFPPALMGAGIHHETERNTGMKQTVEKKEAVKNGVLRMVVVVVSMVIGVLVLFTIIMLAGQKAGWVYTLIHFIGLFLVLGIYASYKTSSIRMTWMFVIMAVPIFGTLLYLFIGFTIALSRQSKKKSA